MAKILRYIELKCADCGFPNMIPVYEEFFIEEPVKCGKCGKILAERKDLVQIAVNEERQKERNGLIIMVVGVISILLGAFLAGYTEIYTSGQTATPYLSIAVAIEVAATFTTVFGARYRTRHNDLKQRYIGELQRISSSK